MDKGTLDEQGQIRFFGAETAPSFVFLIAGPSPTEDDDDVQR